jgi:uncharacterized protein (TIGR03437 family)
VWLVPLFGQEADNPKERQDYFYEPRRFPSGVIPEGARLRALNEMDRIDRAAPAARKRLVRSAEGSWTLIGPRPTGAPTSNKTAGRVAAIAIDPRDNNVMYLGAASGGVWKTTDGGQNWTNLTDDQPSIATGSLALDPLNPDIVYAGTGEQNFSADSYYGAGILKSTDGGSTWRNIVGPFNRQRIGGLSVNARDTKILLAASDANGLYRSTDAGETWTQVLSGAAATSVIFDPLQPNIAWAALGATRGNARNGVYRSVDDGATWTQMTGSGGARFPTTSVGRIELAMAPATPDTIYAMVADGSNANFGRLLGIYRTEDAGQSWNRLNTIDPCGTQCWYDITIRVHPFENNIIYAGGVTLMRSMDGGTTWQNVPSTNATVPHVDHHVLVFTRDGTRLINGNDGGVWSTVEWRSQSTVAWSNHNETLAITQFYPGLSIHPLDPKIGLGGTQDNGTQRYSNAMNWSNVTCGDGGWTAIDPSLPQISYGTCQNLDIRRSLNLSGTGNWLSGLVRGIDPDDRIRFIPAFVMDPVEPQRLYYATQRLYRSTDGGGKWNVISPDLAATASTITSIAIAPGVSNTIYTGSTNGRVWVTTDGGQSWTERTAGLPARAVMAVAVDPADPGTVYVGLSSFGTGHVYKSTAGGSNWTNISGNLPDTPVNDIVVDPDLPDTLYLATDIGVLFTTDGGQTWNTLGTGLPRVVVHGIKLHRASRTLRAATHGRSMWDITLAPVGNSAPVITSINPTSRAAGLGDLTLTVTGSGFGAGTRIFWNGQERTVSSATSTSMQVAIPGSDVEFAGRAAIVAYNPARGAGLSNAMNITIGSAPTVNTDGIASAAFFDGPKVVAPGQVATLKGDFLAPGIYEAAPGTLPVTLGGVTMAVGATTAPLYFVSPKQINFQVPWTTPIANTSVLVTQGLQTGSTATMRVAVLAPSLFALNYTGEGQGAIRIANTAIVAAPLGAYPFETRPAVRGQEYIEIYCTGLGAVGNRPATGAPALSNPLSRTTLDPQVKIGGLDATVSFSGLAPGSVGLYQVNALIPAGVTPGDAVPVVLTIGGSVSNTVTVAIR